MLAQGIVSHTSSGVGEGIGGVYLYGLVVVLDGPFVLIQIMVGNPTVVVSKRIVGVYQNGSGVFIYGQLVLPISSIIVAFVEVVTGIRSRGWLSCRSGCGCGTNEYHRGRGRRRWCGCSR